MTSSKLICIVDDNSDYQVLLYTFFLHYCPHHATRCFGSGQSFLEALAQMNPLPSLILLDRHMPGLDGHQVLTALKQHPTYKPIPVVILSADSSDTEIAGCYEAGANSFVAKNFDAALVKKSISTLCRYWLELNQSPLAN